VDLGLPCYWQKKCTGMEMIELYCARQEAADKIEKRQS